MGSLPQADSSALLAPPLIPTEQIGPKGWVRYIFAFELPTNYDASEVEKLLRASFTAAKARTPLLGCEAIPLPSHHQAGAFQLRLYGDEIEDFKAKDLRADASFPWSFAELKARRFPVEALHQDVVCFRGEWPEAGDRLPVTLMQANFIRGGLLLNWCIFHAYADGTAAFKFTEILAEEVRKQQGLKPFPFTTRATKAEGVEVPSADRANIMRSSGLNPGLLESHPEFMELPFTPPGPPPKLLQKNNAGRVWYFSPAKLAALKDEASRGLDASKGEYVTTNDAIAALVWRTVMKAQFATHEASQPATSLLTVAVDGRRRTRNPAVHKDTIGNFIGFTNITHPLSALQRDDASLSELARLVRRGVASADQNYLDSLTTAIERLEDVSRLVATVFLDMPGPNTLYTTWREFRPYDLDFGPRLGGRIQAVRLPLAGMCNGAQIVLPECPDGGVEVFVGVENEYLEGVFKDELWRRFAEYR